METQLSTDKIKSQIIRFLLICFPVTWALHALAIRSEPAMFTVIVAASMFIPGLAALASGLTFRTIGWRLPLRRHIWLVLAAWVGPAVLSAIGAWQFYMVFPQAFDPQASAMTDQLAGLVNTSEVSQGTMLAMLVAQAVFLGPIINAFFAVGEEVGWRAFLNPRLEALFGRNLGDVIGGVIWGIWHWPLIILAGYNYGSDYMGAPWAGPLVFLLFTISIGVILQAFYRSSHSIWLPALFHGGINASNFVALWFNPAFQELSIWGPGCVGFLSMIPFIIVARAISRYRPAIIQLDDTNHPPA